MTPSRRAHFNHLNSTYKSIQRQIQFRRVSLLVLNNSKAAPKFNNKCSANQQCRLARTVVAKVNVRRKTRAEEAIVTGIASFAKPPYYNPAILGIETKSQDDPYKKKDKVAAAIVLWRRRLSSLLGMKADFSLFVNSKRRYVTRT